MLLLWKTGTVHRSFPLLLPVSSIHNGPMGRLKGIVLAAFVADWVTFAYAVFVVAGPIQVLK